MIREYINSTLQNKNAVMFITSIMFMTGILSYFNNCEITVSAILTLAFIILIFQRRLSIKYALFWIFIFYFGFFNSYFRVKNTDELYKVAPLDAQIEGQIVSIPNFTDEKITFFLNVDNFSNKSFTSKTYITLYKENTADKNISLNIGDYVNIEGKIRRPFKSGTPSQFD